MTLAFAAGGVKPEDLPVDDDSARRILIRAREVAPCLREFGVGSEQKKDALAILRGVAKRAAAIGTGVVSSQGRNGTNISYRDIKSAFFPEDVSGLRSLCGDCVAPQPRPRGSFPLARPLANLWPEGDYS